MKQWITKGGVQIFRVVQGRCNCYLVSKEQRFLLVDTGGRGGWRKLALGLDRLGAGADSVISLALTHCHFDHTGNAARFKRTYQAPILVQRSEEDLLRSGDNPVIKGTMLYTKILCRLLSREMIASRMKYEPVVPDVLVDDALRLEPYGISGFLLHTPGHTPGSISAVIDDEIAIVGDAMFGIFPGSVFPPFAVDVSLMVKSWKKLLDTGCKTFLPAHGSERSADLLERNYKKYCRR